jgi:putative PIN family toxin of toxin-antitoxin system
VAQGTTPVVLSVTLDTSVYVGTLNSRGFGGRLFGLAQAGSLRIDLSDAILDETIRVLRDKFGWDGYRLHDVRSRLINFTNRVTPTELLDVIKEDPPDNRVLECAVEARSAYIVTWDRDLLRLGTHSGIPILRPGDFLQLVRG